MSIRDEFEQHWSQVYKADSGILGESIKRLAFDSYQAAAASKQSEIDELKDAIREFLDNESDYFKHDDSLVAGLENLRNLFGEIK